MVTFKTSIHSIPKTQNVASLTPLARELRAAVSVARLPGFKGNQAVLSANRVVKEMSGHDCMAIMGATHLISENQEIHLTASILGKPFGLSGQKMNKLLEKNGLIKSYRDHKNRLHWKPTEKGRRYTAIKDTGKKHGDGTPVQQVFYLESISTVINQ